MHSRAKNSSNMKSSYEPLAFGRSRQAIGRQSNHVQISVLRSTPCSTYALYSSAVIFATLAIAPQRLMSS